MLKLFTVYLPKEKGERIKDRNVINMLKSYTQSLKIAGVDYSLITSPGYLSRNDGIGKFYDALSDCLFGDSIGVGILKGMNSQNLIKDHKCRLDSDKIFWNIKLKIKEKDVDHRKMVVLYSQKTPFEEEICKDNYSKYLESVEVYGVFLGSSNFSNTTYFDNVAKKGEADIFMFYGWREDGSIDENGLPIIYIPDLRPNSNAPLSQASQIDFSRLSGFVISESIYGDWGNGCNMKTYLKKIMENILINGIE